MWKAKHGHWLSQLSGQIIPLCRIHTWSCATRARGTSCAPSVIACDTAWGFNVATQGFPGVFRCVVAGFFLGKVGGKNWKWCKQKRQGRAKICIYCIYIYGLFIEDVYIYTRIRKETCPFVGRKRKFFVRTTTTVKGQRVSHQLLEWQRTTPKKWIVWISTHRIHGTGILTYTITIKSSKCRYKYIIHGWYGVWHFMFTSNKKQRLVSWEFESRITSYLAKWNDISPTANWFWAWNFPKPQLPFGVRSCDYPVRSHSKDPY